MTTKRRYIAGVFVFLFGLFVCKSARADSRDRTIFQYRHTGWTSIEGSQLGWVRDLAQTSDGYLWIAAIGGLCRFDGVQFERIDLQAKEGDSSDQITALLATPDGGLWIGFQKGAASFLKDGQITSYGASDGFPKGMMYAFARDSEGVIWAAGDG